MCVHETKKTLRERVCVFEEGRTENGIGRGEAEMMTL